MKQQVDPTTNETFFEAWVDYPLDKFGTRTTMIPVYGKSPEELRRKMIIANSRRECIKRERKFIQRNNLSYKLLDDFSYLLRSLRSA